MNNDYYRLDNERDAIFDSDNPHIAADIKYSDRSTISQEVRQVDKSTDIHHRRTEIYSHVDTIVAVVNCRMLHYTGR